MNTFIKPFLSYLRYERGYSALTVAAYERDLLQFEAFVRANAEGAAIDVRLIDADCVRSWMVSLLDRSMASSSVNRKLSSLKSFFKFLLKQGVLSESPVRLLVGPKMSRPLPSFVKEKEMADLLDGSSFDSDFEGSRDRLLLEMLYQTGLRRSELVGIRHADVDMEAMQLRVNGKRNKQRIIPFAERLKEMIVHYISEKEKEISVDDSMHLFVRKNGKPLTGSIVYRIVRERLSGVPMLAKCSPHVLRHSFATSMLNDGAELNAVKELLGHGSLASTSVYTHITFEELKKMYHAHPRAKK
ncbi:tyrosine-type recombinase/integrase [Tannerella sp.]|uniref:tyrosine-type recombinase/integrase n=1 Tax=Tannerella sp. TaxID=2382127 RepID=UPI0026DBD8DA|nr:tyrosine-type recombinase/integrase [Tannerella sp.]MDO4703151.1 tyrosine-type recombinase/integrase [Tannerella sp.]